MEKFAKLFDLKDGSQVLVTKEPENEDGFNIAATTNFNGTIKATASFETEEEFLETFNNYDLKKAEHFRKGISKLME